MTQYPEPKIVASKTNKKGEVIPDKKVEQYLNEWFKGKSFVNAAIQDFQALDTVANAQYTGGTKKNPQVGDTTTAGIVRQIMRTAVKKIPHVTVYINGSKTTLEAIICQNIVDNNILDPTTFGKGFVNILHLGGRGAISRGFTVWKVTAKNMYGDYGVVPELVHFADFAIEPGVQDGSHSSYFYIRTKWTPGKLASIIKRESAKPASKRTYNVDALKALQAQGPDGGGAADYAQYVTPQEQSKIEMSAETFDVITRYSSDSSEPICTFSPGINQVLREVDNLSKFGYPRTLMLVIDPAELSPFGDSRVRLASPNQNFLMALRQNVATTWMYNSKPAVVKSGLFTGATSLKSGTTMTSTDPNAKVTLLTLDTSTSQQYPTISQEIIKQIQTMMGMNPGQALGAIGDSKTGIGAQKQAQGLDDAIQQVTTILEEFLCQYVISGLDLILSEQEGESVIYVDDDTKKNIELMNLPTNPFPIPEEPNGLVVDWAKLYKYVKKIKATVDTTMSKQDWTDEKRGDLQDAVTVAAQTTDPNDPAAVAKKNILQDKLISETAPELTPALDSIPAAQPQQDLTQMQQ